MNTMSLFARISAVFFVSCLVFVFTGCGEPPTSLKLESEYIYNPPTYTKPDKPKKEFEQYVKILKNIPLDFSEINHDFSDMDTVRNHGGWIVDLFHFMDNGRRDLYVLFSNNHVLRISGSQLALEWTVELPGKPSSKPAITDEEIVWLTDKTNLTWYYRDKQPDQNQMRYRKNLQITPACEIAANNSGVYMASSAFKRMYGFDERRKLEKWYWPDAQQGIESVTMTPYASDDRLFFYNNNQKLYCISSDDGTQKWSFDVDYMNANFAVKDAGNDKLFFIPSWSSKLYCMNTAREIYWSFHAQEPIVSTPFVEDGVDKDHYVIFQTPSYMTCVKYYYNPDVQSGQGMIRLVDPKNPGTRKANEPVWQLPLFPDTMKDILPGGKKAMEYSSIELMEMKSRFKFKPLLIGKKWLYILHETEINGEAAKFIRRIDLETGALEEEGYDVSAFDVIVGSNDENDRSIYFATWEGFLFVMNVPQY